MLTGLLPTHHGEWPTRVTPDLVAFLAELDMFYLGTAHAEGQPYIQYRGGPVRRGSCESSTTRRLRLPTLAATGSPSRQGISPRTRRRSSA